MLHRSVTSVALVIALSIAAYSTKAEPVGRYPVEDVPLSQISADLAAGKTTSGVLTEAYIARIKTYDAPLKSVILIAPDAIEQAAASDKRRAAGKTLGPLDGVPILFKDNIDAVGMPTTAGSYALEANMPARDSAVVQRLRAAGAVILGKTNMSQWAGFRTKLAFNGSTVGGGPHNPYDLTRSACGSSNGSGVAAAASFGAAAIGTETSGSVVCPASFTGLVGIKPTIALVARRGIVPISLTQDSAGSMTRTVTDAAMLLTVMAGSDPADPRSRDADAHKADYVKALSTGALKGKRLGVVRSLAGYDDKTQPAFDAALRVLAAQGAELVEIPSTIFEGLSPEMRLILLYDFKEDLNAYLAGTPAAVKTRTLAQLISFSRSDPRESMHGVNIFEDAQATNGGRQNPAYIRTLEYAKRKAGQEGIDRALTQYGVSALVTVTNGTARPIPADGANTGYVIDDVKKGATPANATNHAAIAGYPHITVPMGFVDNLPVGLSFIATAWSDQFVLSLGYAYEQASHKRVPPTLKPISASK